MNITQINEVIAAAAKHGRVVCSINPYYYDDDSGLPEPDAILAAYCVSRLPRLLSADRVHGKVVVP